MSMRRKAKDGRREASFAARNVELAGGLVVFDRGETETETESAENA